MRKDKFGNKKPVPIELDMWWYGGRIIMKHKHPRLSRYHSEDDIDSGDSRPRSHSTFNDAIQFCYNNQCASPSRMPNDYGTLAIKASAKKHTNRVISNEWKHIFTEIESNPQLELVILREQYKLLSEFHVPGTSHKVLQKVEPMMDYVLARIEHLNKEVISKQNFSNIKLN